jgi:glycosyltransferase involved in cell wall biosynthesis
MVSNETKTHLSQLKVLILAETANPEWASVPLIGWSLSQAISKQVEAHIVTQIRNRNAFLRAGLVEGRDFTAIDNERVVSPLFSFAEKLRGGTNKGWTTSTAFSSLAYYSFEWEVWRHFQSRLAAREFDLVHRVTPVSPTSQSLIAKRLARLKIPFIIGPLNGGVPWPKNFTHRQKAEHDWLSDLRWIYKFMPSYSSTRQHASAIICGSHYTCSEMPDSTQFKRVYIPENGVDLNRFPTGRRRTPTPQLRAAFVGRLVPYKGVDLLFRAAVDFLKRNDLELHIIGDGPERPALEALAAKLTIDKNIIFHGWVAHVDVQHTLRACDFTVLPSIREFGGGVVIESMALGIPPIVADYGGPAELVDDSRGIRVAFTDETSLVEGLRTAIATFVRNPTMLQALGAAGQTFVKDKLVWEAKARQILTVYQAVLAGERDLSALQVFSSGELPHVHPNSDFRLHRQTSGFNK